MRRLLGRLAAGLRRRVFGISGDEVRYTFEDVRSELRATRAELKEELAAIRRDLARLASGTPPRGGGGKPKAEA